MDALNKYHQEHQQKITHNGITETLYNYQNNPSIQIPLLIEAINDLQQQINILKGLPSSVTGKSIETIPSSVISKKKPIFVKDK